MLMKMVNRKKIRWVDSDLQFQRFSSKESGSIIDPKMNVQSDDHNPSNENNNTFE